MGFLWISWVSIGLQGNVMAVGSRRMLEARGPGGTPIYGWFGMEHPLKTNDLGPRWPKDLAETSIDYHRFIILF